MGPGLTLNFVLLENHLKIALNQYWYFGVVYNVCINYTLLKVVNYYDLSVMSMSVLGFQKKDWMGCGWVVGWVGWAPSKFILDFFNFASPLHCQPMNRSISLGVCANRIVLCEIQSFIYCNWSSQANATEACILKRRSSVTVFITYMNGEVGLSSKWIRVVQAHTLLLHLDFLYFFCM